MNKVISDLGYEKNPSFRDVFSTKMSKSVVNSYWQKLIKERNLGLFSIELSHKEVLQNIFIGEKGIKPKQAIYLFGLFTLARSGNGMRELRSIVSKHSHDRTWYRLAKDVRNASDLISKNNLRSWVKEIDKEMKSYKVFKVNKK